MEDRIREIMAEVFELSPDKLLGSFKQEDIDEWDSLRHLNLIVELETAFDVSYEPEEIGEMHSFDAVVNLTRQKTDQHA